MMNYILKQKNKNFYNKKGFAMLFTVLIVTLILVIAIGISNTALKQTILSGLARDSQVSFYQADSAIECGLYYDYRGGVPLGTDVGTANKSFNCGNSVFILDEVQSRTDYLIYKEDVPSQTQPCSEILFDKENLVISGITTVEGRGYNVCNNSIRQTERAIRVQY